MKNHTSTRLADLPDVLTVPEAGEAIRLGRDAAYEAARKGVLPTVRIGRRLLVPKAALLRLLDRAGEEAG